MALFVLALLLLNQGLSVLSQGSISNAQLWACTEAIWTADTNSFSETEITYDLASTTLFASLNESRLETGTYPTFRTLLSSFDPNLNNADTALDTEIDAFLAALITTPPIIQLHQCLLDWGIVTGTIQDFTIDLKTLWFYKYARDGSTQASSSAFEHIFQGELSTSGQSVLGFYGWLNVYEEESSTTLQYGGAGTDCTNDLVGLTSFTWSGATADQRSIWIGKSPELEIGLYTACFYTRGIYSQNCNLQVDNGWPVKVISSPQAGVPVTTIASAFFQCANAAVTTTTPAGGSTLPGGSFFQCTEAMWAADNNSFTASEYSYDLNGPVLFLSVNETRFATGTFPYLINLLELFNPQLGINEVDTDQAVQDFLDELFTTGPILEAYSCLNEWGYTTDLADFRQKIQQYWFQPFSRSSGQALDSAGFQHVFQGEVRVDGSEVTGMHDWVNVYREEKAGNFQYGYSALDCGEDLVQINDCVYNGSVKPITSIWVGLSPEIQMALFTSCFMTSMNTPCDVQVGGRVISIVNYSMSGVSPVTIGTTYFGC